MVKIGGVSWNSSPGGKKGVTTHVKCKHCGRGYKIEHYLTNHEKVCVLNPNRYSTVIIQDNDR